MVTAHADRPTVGIPNPDWRRVAEVIETLSREDGAGGAPEARSLPPLIFTRGNIHLPEYYLYCIENRWVRTLSEAERTAIAGLHPIVDEHHVGRIVVLRLRAAP
jgi:hypothetical protein